jgi:two-component system nitrogen regulation sensor histidine kinase GlnL
MTMQPELNQRVLDNLTTAVLMFDPDLKLVYVNPAGEMLLAASSRQVIGSRIETLIHSPALVSDLRQSLASGHPFTEREVILALTGERSVAVDVTVSPLTERNMISGLLLEIVQTERHLRIAREEYLLSQHQLTRTVLRGLAHEIKNPLGGLRGAAQLLERQLNDKGLKEYTEVIIGEADRLQKLLDRLQGPSGMPQKYIVNIHQVLERVRTLVQAEVPDSLKFVVDYDPSIPDVYADPDQLIQAVLNVVRNATQALGGKGQITLRTRAERKCTIGQHHYRLVARIDVIDNGPGIPPELIDKIFYPMVTGHAQGTGLGLSIAQSLVSQHGGLIECASKPGETIFTILLPVEKNDG